MKEKIIAQCRKPTGYFGRMMARAMNRGHKVSAWGLEFISVDKKSSVLDVGCGGGATVKRLAGMVPEGFVVGVDYSADCTVVAGKFNRKLIKKNKVEILQASVEALPFPDEKFHLVTSVESYYFWPDLIENLKEIYRVLKPQGEIVLINECYRTEDFNKRNEEWSVFGGFDYHTPDEFRQFLEKAGFRNIDIRLKESRTWIMVKGKKIKRSALI